MRKRQLKNFAGVDVIYQGSNPSTITAVPSTITPNDWVDYTDSVANYDKLVLSWTLQYNNSGDQVNGSIQIQKGISNTLQFERASYDFIKSWLIDDVGCKVNAIEVKIVDDDCGYYEGYQITSSELSWCEIEGLCVYEITLKQLDPLLQCVRASTIADNWQGWFPTPDKPNSSKKHPRFSYCIETRPNMLLVMGWFLLGTFGGITTLIAAALTPLIIIVQAVVKFIQTIGSIFGGKEPTWTFFTPDTLLDAFKQMFVESAGCGREHPAPLISDYIRNVCDKCGIHYDETTVPIFFADNLTMTTSSSSGQLTTFKNPYKYACYFDAPNKRGIRRFDGISLFGQSEPATSYWIHENAPLLPLDQFLTKLNPLFNTEWRITNGTLYMNRKDQFLNEVPLYDFSKTGSDRGKLIDGICYEPYTTTIGAWCKGLYTVDSIDTSGNESAQQNGSVSFGSVQLNPNFSSGPLDKTTEFSAARFRLDGGTTDYIMDAMQVVSNGQILQLWLIPQMRSVSVDMALYADYALLMAAETTFASKILIWDGASYDNARCIGSAGISQGGYNGYNAPNALQMVAIKTSTNLSTGDQIPEINYTNDMYPLRYNETTGLAEYAEFKDVYPPKTKVIGSEFIFGNGAEPGLYKVVDSYTSSMIYQAVARLVNYPMFFAPQFKGGMWDRFHFIDDPRIQPKMNYNWNCKIPLCCDDVTKLGLTGDGTNAKVAAKVTLTTAFPGRITAIEASYDSSNEVGKYIQLNGEC